MKKKKDVAKAINESIKSLRIAVWFASIIVLVSFIAWAVLFVTVIPNLFQISVAELVSVYRMITEYDR